MFTYTLYTLCIHYLCFIYGVSILYLLIKCLLLVVRGLLLVYLKTAITAFFVFFGKKGLFRKNCQVADMAVFTFGLLLI